MSRVEHGVPSSQRRTDRRGLPRITGQSCSNGLIGGSRRELEGKLPKTQKKILSAMRAETRDKRAIEQLIKTESRIDELIDYLKERDRRSKP